MKDRYRKLLGTCRAPMPRRAFAAPRVRPLDPERVRVLREYVERLIADSDRFGVDVDERRANRRRHFPGTLLMTPCTPEAEPIVSETTMVVGKDLSPRGVSFVHSRAVRQTHVLVTFRMPNGSPICMLTEVKRTQPLRQGLYLVGGAFQDRVSLGADDGRRD